MFEPNWAKGSLHYLNNFPVHLGQFLNLVQNSDISVFCQAVYLFFISMVVLRLGLGLQGFVLDPRVLSLGSTGFTNTVD